MKRGWLIVMFVGAAMGIQAQSSNVPVGEDSLAVNGLGNIIVVRNSNEYTLARFLNTTPAIARLIIGQPPAGDTVVLQQGDSISIDYGNAHVPDTLSCIGRIIYWHLAGSLDRFLFANYWLGGGDFELSGRQFAGILLCLKQQGVCISHGDETVDSAIFPCPVSFYNTPYERSFGKATVYTDSESRVVGFADYYNFDRKKWGVRPMEYECCVRIVSLLSPPSASAFKVYVGPL